MSDRRFKHFSDNMLRIGTPECAVFCASVAMVLALLFLLVGFWRTVLIAALMAIGAFIGGVKNKKKWFADRINKIVPAPKPYREENEAIVRAVREATAGSQPAPEEDDKPEE